jgi:murein DD-endopeptidase MepM/ murein hydrolase activator NlpD
MPAHRRRASALLALLLIALAAGPAASAGPDAGWPLPGRPQVVRVFDPPPQPWLPGHRGVDLAARPGDAVLAPMAGTVVVAGPVVDRGVVVVADGGRRIALEPVEPAVAVGHRVQVGDVVGRVAGGASHCPPRSCLHWGLRVHGAYRDPLLLVLPLRPVLLPASPAPRRR